MEFAGKPFVGCRNLIDVHGGVEMCLEALVYFLRSEQRCVAVGGSKYATAILTAFVCPLASNYLLRKLLGCCHSVSDESCFLGATSGVWLACQRME